MDTLEKELKERQREGKREKEREGLKQLRPQSKLLSIVEETQDQFLHSSSLTLWMFSIMSLNFSEFCLYQVINRDILKIPIKVIVRKNSEIIRGKKTAYTGRK